MTSRALVLPLQDTCQRRMTGVTHRVCATRALEKPRQPAREHQDCSTALALAVRGPACRVTRCMGCRTQKRMYRFTEGQSTYGKAGFLYNRHVFRQRIFSYFLIILTLSQLCIQIGPLGVHRVSSFATYSPSAWQALYQAGKIKEAGPWPEAPKLAPVFWGIRPS